MPSSWQPASCSPRRGSTRGRWRRSGGSLGTSGECFHCDFVTVVLDVQRAARPLVNGRLRLDFREVLDALEARFTLGVCLELGSDAGRIDDRTPAEACALLIGLPPLLAVVLPLRHALA